MRLKRVAFHMTIYGIKSHKFHLKNQTRFFDNKTTSITLTAYILVLVPPGQLGYLNSNLMLRWNGHFKSTTLHGWNGISS